MKEIDKIAKRHKDYVQLAWANRKRQHNELNKAEVAKRGMEMYGDGPADYERHLAVAAEFERTANEYARRATAYRSHLDYIEHEAKNAKTKNT